MFQTKSNKQIVKTIMYITTLLLCMVVAFVACKSKSGYHEDEYYSYYSSNRTQGLWVENESLLDNKTIFDEYAVVPGEGFNFSLVKEVQSWDVHPPLYYFILHFVCSVTAGKFSMWQGLAINLICLALAVVLMLIIGEKLIGDYPIAVAVTTAAWAVSSATLTGVVFIRMYMLLTVWILAVTLLHLIAADRIWFYVALGVLTFLGFMTHYYFFLWLFYLAVLYNVWTIIKTRRVISLIKYGITMIITFAVCYVFYPAFPAQMFRGQRGAQATGNFFDLSNTWERICFFADKVNRIGFGGLLGVYLVLIVAAGIGVFIWSRKEKLHVAVPAMSIILLLSVLGYFLTVSKTALLLGDSSIRYQMPVLGVAYTAIASLIVAFGKGIMENRKLNIRQAVYPATIFVVLLLIANIVSDYKGNISFLYPEKAEQLNEMTENTGIPIIYVYDEGETWCVWDSTAELLTHEEVYLVSGNEEQNGDYSEVNMDDGVIVFISSTVDNDEVIQHFIDYHSEISTSELLFTDDYCDAYKLY